MYINGMESLRSDDAFSESWQNCAFVSREVKVEKLNDEQVEVTIENSIPSCKNSTNEANVTSSIKKKKLQSELVIGTESLPIVVKDEKDINVGRLYDYSSVEDNEYLIEESQKEVTFSLKKYVKTEPSVTDSGEEESLNTFKDGKCSIKNIKEEYFIEPEEIIVQDELDIKDEDEGEDQFTIRSEVGQIEKRNHPRSRTAPLNRLSTNNGGFHLTEPPVFKCLNCTYQTRRKENIARHVVSHKTLECSHCTYKTKNKYHFSRHELIHVPKEQVKLYQCPECSFTSIRKYGLTQHMIKHKKADDAIWYQCSECPYKTKYRASLTYRHMPIHKKNRPMHKCTVCCHETPRKYDLTKHMQRVHILKGFQPVHCQEKGCSFETHHKSNLMDHIRLKHSRKRFFKCSMCSYQTIYSNSFKAHELGHENRNKWFSCTLCPYKATRTSSLKPHMLVHKSDSEIRWFQCSQCPFKTKRSYVLKRHKPIHNLNSQKILKCSECSYKTVLASNFRAHSLVHKEPEEISEWFYCYLCTWRATRKYCLARHIQKLHRDTNGRIKDS